MTEREPFATSGGVETAIKEAARKAAASDPSFDVSKRITLEHFNRFLSRVFSEGENSKWVLKGGTSILARIPSSRSTRDIDLLCTNFTLARALEELIRLASTDLNDHFRFEYVNHRDSIGNDARLSKSVNYCASYRTVELASDLVARLIDPALTRDADGKTWSHTSLDWAK